jgi:hypothetical protein
MDKQDNLIAKMYEEQEYLKSTQLNLFENLNILLENQKSRIENQDLVIQNQSLIIRNQDVIVNNQINIIKNQKQIVENQVTLSAILKTQAKILFLIENMSGYQKSESDVNDSVKEILLHCKEQFEGGILNIYELNSK